MADEKNELVGLRQKVEPVMSFFKGPQVGIFRNISKKIENFKRNAQFLSDEARSNVDEIEGILISAEPYSKIKLLQPLESVIELSLQNSLSNLKQDVESSLTTVKSELEKELVSHKGFTDEFRKSIRDIFNDIEKNAVQSVDCAFVKLQISRIDELYSSAIEKIEKQKSISRETGKGDGEIKGFVVEIFRGSEIFRTKKSIDNEEDLDEYIKDLRTAFKDVLNKKKKIRVI
jgi:Cu/Ag efflux pump CusA